MPIIFSHAEKIKGRGNIFDFFFTFSLFNKFKDILTLKFTNFHTKWGVNKPCRAFQSNFILDKCQIFPKSGSF